MLGLLSENLGAVLWVPNEETSMTKKQLNIKHLYLCIWHEGTPPSAAQ